MVDTRKGLRRKAGWNLQKISSSLALLSFVSSCTIGFIPAPQVWALDNGTSGAGNVQTSALQADYGSCEDQCKKVFDSLTYASGGSETWDGSTTDFAVDAETCAAGCVTTDSANSPNGAHCFEAPTFTAEKVCSIPDQILGHAKFKGLSCTQANKKIMGCKFYNSTLVQQCVVTQKAKKTWYWQEIIIGLDATTATVCAPACVSQTTPLAPASITACKGASFAATGVEIIASLGAMIWKGDGQGDKQGFRFAGMGLGALGMGAAAVGVGGAANASAPGLQKAADESLARAREDLVGVIDDPENRDAVHWLFESEEGKKYQAAKAEKEGVNKKVAEKQKEEDQTEACVTAAIALVLGGIRLASYLDAQGTEKEACEQVSSLYSAAFAAAIASGGDSVINPNNSLVVSSSDGKLTGSTASGAAMSVTGGVGGDKSTPSVGDIMGGEGFAATAEGMLLGPSGLGNIVGPLASQIDRNAFRKAISRGPAGFTQAALGGVGLNAAQAQAANDIVKRANDKAPQLASKIGGSMYAGGGGGSGSKVAASAGGSPFGGLFGAKSGPGGTDAMSFGAVQRDPAGRIISSDIWHTGTDKNLFQIVSERVRVVEPRLK